MNTSLVVELTIKEVIREVTPLIKLAKTEEIDSMVGSTIEGLTGLTFEELVRGITKRVLERRNEDLVEE